MGGQGHDEGWAMLRSGLILSLFCRGYPQGMWPLVLRRDRERGMQDVCGSEASGRRCSKERALRQRGPEKEARRSLRPVGPQLSILSP